MIELHSIREKLSWQVVLFVLLYLVAAVILFAVFLPARSKRVRLVDEVAQLERAEQSLLSILETRSTLEAAELEVQARLLELARTIPSQYDLPGVLAILDELSLQAALTLDSLEHVPLKVGSSNTNGVIPLTFTLSGSEMVYTCILKMQELLPSLQVTEVSLNYLGDDQFQALVRADLHVFVLERASASTWEAPELTPLQPVGLDGRGFGVPFEVVVQFLQPNVQVLGVVEAGGGSSVLLSKDGVQSWYQVGDRFGVAVVSNIFGRGVWLDIDGVQLKLTVGG